MKAYKGLLKNVKKYSVLPVAVLALNGVAIADTEFKAVQDFSNDFIQKIGDTTTLAQKGTQTLIDETKTDIQILMKKVEVEAFELANLAEENAKNLALQAGKTEAEAKAFSEAAAQEVFRDAALVIDKFRALGLEIQNRNATWLESVRITSTGDAQLLLNTIENVSKTVAGVGKDISAKAISDLKWAAVETISGATWAEDQAKAYLIMGWNAAWDYATSWVSQAENATLATEQLALSMFNSWKNTKPAQTE